MNYCFCFIETPRTTKMKRKRDEVEDTSQSSKKARVVPFVKGKWSRCTNQLADWFDREEKQQEEDNQIVPRHIHVATTSEAGALYDIERRVSILRKTYYNGFSPSPQQRALFDLIITINLRWVVGERYEMYKPLLLTELQLAEIKRDLHYIMSRQQGKTTAVSETGVTMALHIPFKQSIFSTGGRTSKAMMKQMRAAARRRLTADEANRIIQENESELKIRVMPLEPCETELYSETRAYPASGASKIFFVVVTGTKRGERERGRGKEELISHRTVVVPCVALTDCAERANDGEPSHRSRVLYGGCA